jgi:phage tail sheath protein FI
MATYLSPGVNIRETDFSYYVKQLSTAACGMIGVAERGPLNVPTLVTSWEQFLRKFGGYIQSGYLAYAARSFFDNGGAQLWVNRIAHYTDPLDKTTLAAICSSVSLKNRNGVKASVNTGLVGTDRIKWEAVTAGAAGNAITIALLAAGNDTPLSVNVVDRAITVNLATDSGGAPTSTVADVLAAVAAKAEAAALVAATSTDIGVVSAAAVIPLTGGLDPQDALKVSASNEGSWGDQIAVQVENGTRSPETEFNIIVRYRNEIVEVFRDLSLTEAASNYVELVINGSSEYISIEDKTAVTPTALHRPGLFSLTAGDDGLTGLADEDYIGVHSEHTGFSAFEDVFDLNLLCVPGVTTGAVLNAALTYAELRKDIFCILDTPMGLNPQEAINFRHGTGSYNHEAFNSSFGALYWPWLTIQDPVTGNEKIIPSSGAVAGCYVRSDQKAYVWSAPAGIDRGRIFNVQGVAYLTQRADQDALYPEGINVIAVFPDSGVNIWGQKTLLLQASALDRVNVRRLMIYMERAIGDSSRFVTFEPNHPQTWRALLRLINPFLQDIKSNGGVYDYRVQCDAETNPPAVQDRNEMVARVYVKPTKAAEFIELNFVMTESGGNFNEIFNS